MDHEAEDAHLGGTTVVELDGLLLLVLAPLGSAALLDLLLLGAEAQLHEADEGEDLGSTGGRDDVEGLEAGGNIGKLEAVGDLSRETDTSGGHKVAKDGKHRDAAVLGLHVTEAVKTLLVSIVEEAEGIPETKGSLGTDLCENLAFAG